MVSKNENLEWLRARTTEYHLAENATRESGYVRHPLSISAWLHKTGLQQPVDLLLYHVHDFRTETLGRLLVWVKPCLDW
jgi:hypothetical protein